MLAEFYRKKKVLITGGYGFIGSRLAKVLGGYGAEVFIVDNREKHKKRIGYFNKCDIRNYSKLREVVADISPQIVFHLAANTSRISEFDAIYDMIDNNLIGTVNLLKSLKEVASFQSVIIAGTIQEYGINKLPFKEDLKENPTNPYCFSKVCISHLCKMVSNVYKLPVLILRATLAYGPGQEETMFIPSLIGSLLRNKKFLMTKGEQTRDFIYIDDLINAYIKAGMIKNNFGEIFNIGLGKDYKISKIARLVASIMNKEHLLEIGVKEYRKSEMMFYHVDISKAKKLLDWCPVTSLKEGLKKTIKSYYAKK